MSSFPTASSPGEPTTSGAQAHALTASQRALWSSQRRHPDSPLQNMALLTHIDGAVEVDRLVGAFDAVVAESRMLRLTIGDDDTAVVLDHQPVTSEILHMPRQEVAAWARLRVEQPIDVSRAVYDSVVIGHDDGTASWYLCLHHVATDATSSALIFQATTAAYHGEPFEIDDLPNDSAPSNKRRERARAFWAERTPSPLVETLYQPIDQRTTAATRHEVPFDLETMEAALDGPYRMISRDLGWTALLMTAIAVHLHRVSNADRFAIGLPVHNRSGRSSKKVIGPLMEVYPVDIAVEPDMTFAQLHNSVSRQLMTVVGNALPNVGATGADVSAIVNVIPRGSMGSFGSSTTSTDWIHPGAADPHHLLGVQLTTYRSERPDLYLDLNDGGASPAHQRSAVRHLHSILAAMAADPEQTLLRCSLASDDDLAEVRSWGAGSPLPPSRFVFDPTRPRSTGSVVDRLSVALANGARPAVIDGALTLTGRVLWERAGTVAANLTASGVGPGDRIGVEMPRSSAAVTAILGILRAGASYVPIDPNLPLERRRQIEERAGLRGVLTDLDGIDPALVHAPRPPLDPDDEAYLLFTSGSTGTPKGVPITHGGLADYLAFASTEYLGPHQRRPVAPLFTSLGFDLTVTTLFLPLIAGGTLVTVADDGVPGLRTVAARSDLTWIKATPSHLELLARFLPDRHRISTMVVGGEAFPARLAHRLAAGHPRLEIFNEYGPTEAVVGCMIHRFDTATTLNGDVPIGHPAPGVTLRIVDSVGNDVPPGVPGELVISSAGLSPGYLGQEPDTAPFGRDGFGRWYRTGDVVRLAGSAGAVYLGRIDEQVKLNGVRIEPAEIVAALESHPSVERAVVRSWRPDGEARPFLAAWIEAGSSAPTPTDLRSYLLNRLASHQLPAAITVVDTLPFTSNGKLDIGKLPTPHRIHAADPADRSDVDTPLGGVVRAAWREALRLEADESLDAGDDFFVLGGDSLAALEMVSSLSEELAVDIGDGLPFAASTLGDFVAAVAALDPGSAASAGPEPGQGGLGLSPAEEAMLFEHRLAPESARYNIGRRYVVDAAIDPDRLRAAAERVVERHRPLHTTVGGQRTVLASDAALQFTVAPAGSDAALDDEQSQQVADALYRSPFHLEHGPLLRVALHRLTAGEDGLERSAVVVASHHISGDAGSLDRLWNDLDAAYSGRDLPALEVTYADHAAWQRTRDHGETFWRELWNEPVITEIGLPGAAGDHRGGYVERPASFSASALRRAPGRTPTATGLAVVAKLLDRHHGVSERPVRFGIGLTASTREHPSSEPMVGYFLNTLPLVIDVPSVDTSFAELAANAGDVLGRALPHRSHPFAAMVARARRDGRPLPVPDVLLAVEDLAPATLGGAPARHEVLASGEAVAPVTIFIQLRDERVDLGVEFAGSVMDRDRALLMLADLDALFVRAIESQTAAERDVAAMPSEQRGRLEGVVAPDATPLVAEILAHTHTGGEAPAVSCGAHQLSWAELGRRSALLAERLRINGVGSGDRVAVSMLRSVDLVVAVVAVLRAGAVYVPVDPTYPDERRERILRAASPAVAIVEPGADIAWIPSLRVPSAADVASPEANASGRAEPRVDEGDPAYVIFTSGSTGQPKGVEVDHGRLATSTRARDHVYGAGPDRFLLLSSIGFDSSIVGLFWTLRSGGTIVVPTEAEAHDPDALLGVIERERVSHVLMVPTLYRALLTRGASATHWPAVVTVAGEACPAELVGRHHELRPDAELWNEYGPTEGTVWVTAHRCRPSEDPVPIGAPIPGAWCAVVDDRLLPVPAGAAGELLIGGAGVVDGYLVDDATEAASVDRSFVEHERWGSAYRTGDQVAQASGADGSPVLRFLGRVDDQLNVDGVRLEPAEVERVLVAVDGVVAAAVVAGRVGERTVVAAHVEGVEIDVATLRAVAARELPGPARPARYVVHDRLPVTVHGKIDRRALSAMELPDDATVRSSAPPADDIERAVLDLFCRHTRSQVGLDDGFFDAGGDSLAALTLAIELEDHFGQPFSVTALLAEPTARAVAAQFRPRPEAAADGASDEPLVDRTVSSLVEWIREGEPGRPVLVLLAPGSGHLLGYEPLIRALSPATPLLGVRLPGYDGKDAPIDSVPGLVELVGPLLNEAIEQRSARIGSSPVVLLGGSSGGLLAWELQHRAEQAGTSYDGIIMQDTVHPDWRRRQAAISLPEQLQALYRTGGAVAVGQDLYGRVERRVTQWQRARRSRAQASTTGAELPEVIAQRMFAAITTALAAYRPPAIARPILFLAASNSEDDATYSRWRAHTSELEVKVFDGDHFGENGITAAANVAPVAAFIDRYLAAIADPGQTERRVDDES